MSFVSQSPARRIASAILWAILAAACSSDDTSEGNNALMPAPSAGAGGSSVGAAGSGSGGAALAGAGAGGGAATPEGMGGAPLDPGAAGAAAVAGSVDAGGGAAPLPELVRLVPVGDSTTQATCWRALLWQRLGQDFPGRVDFVGSHQNDNACAVPGYDQDNEAYGGALVTEIVAGITTARTCNPPCPTLDDLRSDFAEAPADVALLHFGTNDVWNNIAPGDGNAPAPGSILAAYDAVVGALREANPDIRILVAQIIPLGPTEATCAGCTCADCPGRVSALNAQISSWAARLRTPQSPISVVDQETGYDVVADNRDGVHPNDSGSQKMATRWYEALAPLLQ